MRVYRWFVVAAIVGSALASASPARADGGAYLSFDETYYVRGDHAHGEGYVFIPASKRDILDRGPFSAYLLTSGRALVEGEPLPAGTIRLATVDVEQLRNGETELAIDFVVPDVASGTYTVQICNDPCTIAGFREPQTGQLTITATALEAVLMRDRDRLGAEVYGLQRKLRKGEREREDLLTALDAAVTEREQDALRIAALEARPTVAPTFDTASAGRPLADPWTLVTLGIAGLVVVLAIGTALAFGRTTRAPVSIHE